MGRPSKIILIYYPGKVDHLQNNLFLRGVFPRSDRTAGTSSSGRNADAAVLSRLGPTFSDSSGGGILFAFLNIN